MRLQPSEGAVRPRVKVRWELGFEERGEGTGREGVGARRADLGEGEEGEVAVRGGEDRPYCPAIVVAVLVDGIRSCRERD